MQLKPSAFQLAILWAVMSFLVTACGPSVDCDDPGTPFYESCGTSSSTGGYHTGVYYRSGSSTFGRSRPSGSTVRSGFGKSGGARSGFG